MEYINVCVKFKINDSVSYTKNDSGCRWLVGLYYLVPIYFYEIAIKIVYFTVSIIVYCFSFCEIIAFIILLKFS